MRDINRSYSDNAFNINENAHASLGVVAMIGFIIACVWVICRLVYNNMHTKLMSKRMDLFSLVILTLVLYSVGGGFGAFVSYFVISEFRCLNRSSVVIACLSLCVVAITYEFIYKTVKKNYKLLCSGILLALTVFAAYSESSGANPNWQDGLKQEDAMLVSFFGQIEDSLEDNAMVYELPFVPFPEMPPINGMADYELVTPYLYTDTIRWSYGGMKGRDTTAESLYIDNGMSEAFVDKIKNAGFEGVYIDTLGYEDGGSEIVSFYRDTLGITPIETDDGWLYFFKIVY